MPRAALRRGHERSDPAHDHGHRPARARAGEVYATIPSHGNGRRLRPLGGAAMPIDITFDAAGNAYICRRELPRHLGVPPGGGEAEPWFVDPQLQGVALRVAAASWPRPGET